jgi:hypothetical protein
MLLPFAQPATGGGPVIGAPEMAMRSGIGRRRFCAGALAGGATLIGGLGATSARGATTSTSGLVVTYHALSGLRPLVLPALQRTLGTRLRQWQSDGVIANHRILFNRHADVDLWDAMALIEFAGGGAAERWNALEREFPAGLDAQTLGLIGAVHTVPVELTRHRNQAPVPPKAVVLAIPYQALVSAAEYIAYADGYVIPQFDGWLKEGVLSQYSLWSASYPASRPWTHLLLLDYRSEQALAARDAVVAKVRAELMNVPQWRAVSENKSKIREEKQLVVADDITPAANANASTGNGHD